MVTREARRQKENRAAQPSSAAPASRPSPAGKRKKPAQRAASFDSQDIDVCITDSEADEQSPAKRVSPRIAGNAPAGKATASSAGASAGHASPAEQQAVGTPGARACLSTNLQAPVDAAVALLRLRLCDVRCSEDSGLRLRPHLQGVVDKLVALMADSIDHPGCNNSALVIGARGTGKTLAIERALGEIHRRYNTDSGNLSVGVVRLSGLLHTDERITFREMARQLCGAFNLAFSRAASLEENMAFLRQVLLQLARGHKVALFVLDEFDLFARRAKQNFLYEMLDAVASAGVQAAVVGLSCRHDTLELMEKRVRSRFSHRKLLLTELTPGAEDAAGNSVVEVLEATLQLPASFPDAAFAARFNAGSSAAVREAAVQQELRLFVDSGHSTPRDAADVASQALCMMDRRQGHLQAADLLAALSSLRAMADSQVAMVSALSVLELFMLVAMARVSQRGDGVCNFETAWHEYTQLLGTIGGSDRYPRHAAWRAFESLVAAGLAAYTDSRAEARGGLREYFAAELKLARMEIAAGLRAHRNCPEAVRTWLAREGGHAAAAAD